MSRFARCRDPRFPTTVGTRIVALVPQSPGLDDGGAAHSTSHNGGNELLACWPVVPDRQRPSLGLGSRTSRAALHGRAWRWLDGRPYKDSGIAAQDAFLITLLLYLQPNRRSLSSSSSLRVSSIFHSLAHQPRSFLRPCTFALPPRSLDTMKHSSTLAAVTAAALARSASAHYIFSKLIFNGEVTDDWEYIRQTTRSESYMPTKFTETYDDLTPNDDDFRCNLGSFSSAADTKVAEVAAGDTIGMKLFYDGSIAHPGPGQVYMSKAPSGNVQEYEGDGDWFKIWERTICDAGGDLTQGAWCTYGLDAFNFSIPADTPAGEYLVRAEHVGLHGAQDDEAEFFYSCAQVKVTGSGSGTPVVTYKIPGLYTEDMTLFNGLNLWVDDIAAIRADIDETPIGDAVWSGGGSSNSSSGSGTSSSSASASAASSSVAVLAVASATTTAPAAASTVAASTATTAAAAVASANPAGPPGCPGKFSVNSAKFAGRVSRLSRSA
ncbi:glycosyl hydrolase family 61-domain-containing protein [Xylariaceae sp. FL0804]|nr:glycosyl hydrolase family 61-domain-containing protein [Xylariaceae sp. FL0804]